MVVTALRKISFQLGKCFLAGPGDQDVGAFLQDMPCDGYDLLSSFILAEDHLRKTLPEGTVVVYLCKIQVFIGKIN